MKKGIVLVIGLMVIGEGVMGEVKGEGVMGDRIQATGDRIQATGEEVKGREGERAIGRDGEKVTGEGRGGEEARGDRIQATGEEAIGREAKGEEVGELRGFGNGWDKYAIAGNVGYAYNIAWSHQGDFNIQGLLPINEHFEAAVRLRASTANVYTVATTIRPKFDVKVGQVFIDMNLCHKFVVRANQYDMAACLALGWRMDYVSVEVGGLIRYQRFMKQAMNEGSRSSYEPFSLLYKMEVYCRPRTSDWNLWVMATNQNDFEVERYTQPLFGLGGWYDIDEHWRATVTASFKPTGMFHMNAVFFGAGVMAGVRYGF